MPPARRARSSSPRRRSSTRPQNREKAKEVFDDLRKKAGPAAKSAAKKAGPAAKSVAQRVTERKKPNPPGGVAPPP